MSAETPVKLTHNEEIKAAIPTLAGTIAATIADPTADHFSEDDNQFLKFHGSYQQDDRDLRKTGKKYIMMIRGRIPGGVMTAKQYGVFDQLASDYGNDTLRITTRQSIQFHGIVKNNFRPVVKAINECLLSTLAACGDVNRNVLAPPTPAYTKAREQVYADAHKVAMALAPQTKAYHAIWIDGVQLDNDAPENKNFVDPLYGKTYLPRKFKIAFVIPPVNDLDVYTNCLGLIAIVENDQLIGYNLAVGGGMGRSHGNEATYPRLADVIGFFTPDKIVDVAKAVLTIHRDFGDRTDRKHARLKYVVAERGVKFMQDEVNRRAGITLAPAKPHQFTTTSDLLGWRKAVDGSWFLGTFVESGRVKGVQKKALREIADKFTKLEFRLAHISDARLKEVLERAAARFGWGKQKPGRGVGYGLACTIEKGARLALFVETEGQGAQLRLRRLVAAGDFGAALNPANLRGQMEGGLIQGIGGALWEQLRFDSRTQITRSLAQYRVPRFGDVPEIEVELIDRRDLAAVGAGESPITLPAPAIANALFAATGERKRSLPLAT